MTKLAAYLPYLQQASCIKPGNSHGSVTMKCEFNAINYDCVNMLSDKCCFLYTNKSSTVLVHMQF